MSVDYKKPERLLRFGLMTGVEEILGRILGRVRASLAYRSIALIQTIKTMSIWTPKGRRMAAISKVGRRALKSNPPDYSLHHLAKACIYQDPIGLTVLVVGCNRGYECGGFIEFGANRVIGIDVLPEIGESFIDQRVDYLHMSAEAMSLPDDSVDLVFAFATMEHIPNIEAAYREMYRVCRPGGLIYCIAAPLWNTRGGPHWGDLFKDTPWPHLRWSDAEIIEAGVKLGPSVHEMRYWIGDHCNRRSGSDYLNACAALGADIIRNKLEFERDDADPETVDELVALGFPRDELFAVQHTFIARKPAKDVRVHQSD